MVDAMSAQGSWDSRTVELTDLLRGALGRQRVDLAEAIDGDVLQYLCLSLQELQDLHRAEPTETLRRACDALATGIAGLRMVVDLQTRVDFAFEVDASMAIEKAMRRVG